MPNNDRQPYVEDVDEDDNPIETHTSSAPPSSKEEANVSRTRNTDVVKVGHRGSGSASPIFDHLGDSESDSAAHARRSPSKRDSRRPKEPKDKEREKLKAKRKSVTYTEQSRPHNARAKTTPNLNIHNSPPTPRRRPEQLAPSHIITAAAPPSRQRANTAQPTPRPLSYYGSPGTRPPLSNQRFYAQPAPMGSFPPPPQSPYPPQSPMFLPPATAPPYAGQYPPAQAFSPAPPFGYPPQPHDYFAHGARPIPPRPIEFRRPRSAMGSHPGISYINGYEDEHDDGSAPVRMASITKRPSVRQQEEDRKLMPPPRMRRPSTTAAAHSPFAPPRANRHSVGSIRSIDLFDTDSVDDDSHYSPSEQSHTDWRAHPSARPSIHSAAYEVESRYERPERSPERRRRNSHYGARAQSTEREYEDKFEHAQRYQTSIDGPTTNLTVDTLRKMARTPSQRTKSTGSRGNDTYALTNRNSIENEIGILVRGTATISIGDASLAVQDGAEIRFPTNLAGGSGTSRGGSNGSDTTYDDSSRRLDDRDRRTRVDRPQRTGRTTSRAGSHSRGLPAPPYYAPSEYTSHGYHPQHAPMYAPPSGLQYPSRG